MQVLLVAVDYPPVGGGISEYYWQLCKNAAGNVGVLTTAEPSPEPSPWPVWHVNAPASRGVLARLMQMSILAFRTIQLCARMKPRVLLLGHLYLLPIGLLARLVLGVRFAAVAHGGEMSRFMRWGWFRKAFASGLNTASSVIANSHFTADALRTLGVRSQVLAVIHPGVDPLEFQPRTVDALPDAWAPMAGRTVLLTVARLVPRKGHEAVIRALPAIVAQHPDVLYVVGGNGPIRQELEHLADSLGVREHCLFLGFVAREQLPALYNVAALFVMPSRLMAGDEGVEGFGIVYAEAAACGIPSIAGRAGGAVEAVSDGETGWLVDPDDVPALGLLLARLLRDPEAVSLVGGQARARVEERFDWRRQAPRFLEVLGCTRP